MEKLNLYEKEACLIITNSSVIFFLLRFHLMSLIILL
jgi:hypothetical protein